MPACEACGGDMRPEHAHYVCLECGRRDSCCEGGRQPEATISAAFPGIEPDTEGLPTAWASS